MSADTKLINICKIYALFIQRYCKGLSKLTPSLINEVTTDNTAPLQRPLNFVGFWGLQDLKDSLRFIMEEAFRDFASLKELRVVIYDKEEVAEWAKPAMLWFKERESNWLNETAMMEHARHTAVVKGSGIKQGDSGVS